MAKKRYKIRKEQLERVVESFVMEAAAPEAKKHIKGDSGSGKMVEKRSNTKNAPEKDWGVDDEPSHAPEAKKHVKGSESGKMVEKRSNSKSASTSTNNKMKHAPEAKKHVKGSVSESEELNEGKRSRKRALEADFKKKASIWSRKGAIKKPTRTDYLEFMAAAEEDGYRGKVGLDKENKTLIYRNAEDINWGGLGLTGPDAKGMGAGG